LFLGLYAWFDDPARRLAGEKSNAKWAAAAPYIAIQILVWIALRTWVNHHFRNNDLGSMMNTRWFGIHLGQNLISLVKPPQWPLFLSVFGFSLPLFIAKFDRIEDRALARSTAIVMALWTAAMLLVGVIVEIRIFSELTAFLMPCIALIIWSQWIRPAARCRAQPG
jgi:hypothetical protein